MLPLSGGVQANRNCNASYVLLARSTALSCCPFSPSLTMRRSMTSPDGDCGGLRWPPRHTARVSVRVPLSLMLLLQGTRLTSLRSTARASTNSLGPRLGFEPLHLPPGLGGINMDGSSYSSAGPPGSGEGLDRMDGRWTGQATSLPPYCSPPPPVSVPWVLGSDHKSNHPQLPTFPLFSPSFLFPSHEPSMSIS